MKRIFTPIVLLLAFSMKFANAQSVTKFVQPDLLETGFSNAQNLFKGYLTPWGNMFGAALNGGWYNTAKPHKLGGFDITFSANIAFAPPSASAFSLSQHLHLQVVSFLAQQIQLQILLPYPEVQEHKFL